MEGIIYTIVEIDANESAIGDLKPFLDKDQALKYARTVFKDKNVAIYEDFFNDNGCYDSNVIYTRINGNEVL